MRWSVAILVPGLFRAKNIVDIEDIIAVLIVKAIILHTLARFRQDATGVTCRGILEARVADLVGCGEVCRQSLQRLYQPGY